MEIVPLGPLPVASILWQPGPRAFALTIVCKATFPLAPGEAALASTQLPPAASDVPWNSDPGGSLSAPTDLAPLKLRAEVILTGSAYAPRGEQVRSLVARLRVAEVDKSIEVFGDRSFAQDGTPMEGPRFARMPLRWERAAGGPATVNPVGMHPEQKDAYGWTPIANLRPVGQPVYRNGAPLLPIGFGPIAPSWPSRRDLLGSRAGAWPPPRWMDEPLPPDIDAAYFNAAPRDQQLELLRDDEALFLENLHPLHPQLGMTLPGLHPRARVERPGAPEEDLPLHADTLFIDTDRSLCTLTWRGRVRLDHPGDPGRITIELAPPRKRGPVIKPGDLLRTLMPSAVAAAAPLPFVTAPPEPSPMSPPRSFEPLPPSEPAPWIAPPASAHPPIVPSEPLHVPGAAELGVLASSDLAAASDRRPLPAPPEERPAAPEPRAKVAPPEAVKLVWFEPALVPRIHRQVEWRSILTDLELRLIDEAAGNLAGGPLDPEAKDRRTVRELLLRGVPIAPDGVKQAIESALGEDGGFDPPLVLLAAELEMPFDELETLKAIATAARPLASTDKRLKEALELVDELLASPWLAGAGGTAESLTSKVREAFAQARRTLSPDYLEVQAERRLLEQRAYQSRPIFGKKHLRGTIRGAAGPLPAYLPEATRDALPMFHRFRAKMLCELDHREDQGEASPFAIKVLALGRVIAPGS